MRALLFIFFLLANTLLAYAEGPLVQFTPPAGQTILVIGQDKNAIDEYLKMVGPAPAGFSFYTSVQNADGISGPADYGGGLQDARYLVEKYPDTVLQVGLYMVGALKEIVDGKYDDNISNLGEWISSIERPVYLRIGYEFDFPSHGYDPGDYQKAYRYIVDRLRKQNVHNVVFVWHSYAAFTDRPAIDWYPGDEYVDWFGISYFFPSNIRFQERIIRMARERKKPVMIAESAPSFVTTVKGKESWDSWFSGLFDFIEKNDIQMVSYINCNWDQYPMFSALNWGDSRLQSNAFVQTHWLQEIKKRKFLHSSPGLFKILGYDVNQ